MTVSQIFPMGDHHASPFDQNFHTGLKETFFLMKYLFMQMRQETCGNRTNCISKVDELGF